MAVAGWKKLCCGVFFVYFGFFLSGDSKWWISIFMIIGFIVVLGAVEGFVVVLVVMVFVVKRMLFLYSICRKFFF